MENKVNKQYFEFLAENTNKLENNYLNKSWLTTASIQKGGVKNQQDLTKKRVEFLGKYALKNTTEHKGNYTGDAKILSCYDNYKNLEKSGLAGLDALPKIENLPNYSAIISLKFQLLSPLLTADDDSFYLFDNPVKKDHIFGVPYLAAASIKGLTSDAFQRAFPNENWKNLGKNDSDRTIAYRKQKEFYAQTARRLFGVANNGEVSLNGYDNEVGRLHFAPIWFSYIQYLVMNPSSSTGNSVPIQFEAIAKDSDKNAPVEATINFWYINKVDGKESSELEVRTDLSLLLAAMSEWLPALGLGAKRLAGYGAIKPLTATFEGKNFKGELSKKITENSWKNLLNKLSDIK